MALKVQTVLGLVDPSELGRTLTHEHLSMEFTHFYRQPPKEIADKFDTGYVVEKLGYLRQYPYHSRNNLLLNDQDANSAVLFDMHDFQQRGGGTIVENTTEGIKRDVTFLKRVSEETKVHIVAGTGFYIADTQESNLLKYTEEALYNHMLKELTEGCIDNPSVKAGFMGEIASVWPIKDFERKAIKAAGELQAQLGFPVSYHPHRVPEAPFEIIRLYLEAGGRPDKVVMSHLDRTISNPETLLEFSDLGTYCQFDLFGTEVSYYQLKNDIYMPSDAQRIEMVRHLVDNGKVDRILMSHDLHTKHRLIKYGGHGYSHIFSNILPWMKIKGFSQETIDTITIQNPARWLAIKI
ncbi:phosphotriesterase-related protein [Aricia agestis]|uniref:phosphotriesterase-related protein n=1 Tax=Aricia agestis TaxID=91739 RepID=UPI001C20726A|nr:phosphotriesterase-related protein [Aricia agestis]